jgi:hypothetical protein
MKRVGLLLIAAALAGAWSLADRRAARTERRRRVRQRLREVARAA